MAWAPCKAGQQLGQNDHERDGKKKKKKWQTRELVDR